MTRKSKTTCSTLIPALVFSFVVFGLSACAMSSSAHLEERNSNWAVPLQVEGLPNLFRVSPDLYRSAQPDETGMQNAKAMGIATVVSLRASTHDPELSAGTGLKLEQVPMTTWNISDEELIAALTLIHTSPKPVLVHCLHGADRTGLVMAFYRMVFQGWTKEHAKDEMLNGGFGFHRVWTNIPEKIDAADIAAIREQVLPAP
ncbi:tyrosine-protein phosphatase [Desulfosarcina sp. OttesenSCG-928-A07]|nr:tyrosine-protein phosphatase [Desulfosarcina sp. OttesenSCG-928-G17]MDL2328483.1 tyrosine-protein phosphatase [Desulfosarcina sp. OttesenSCG-928-A07]